MKQDFQDAAHPSDKGGELHSTVHVPRLCRTFSIFCLRAWCPEPLVCACQRSLEAHHVCTTGQSNRDQAPFKCELSTLSVVSTCILENHPPATIFFSSPHAGTRGSREQQLSAQARQMHSPIRKQAYAKACSHPPITQPQKPGLRACP